MRQVLTREEANAIKSEVAHASERVLCEVLLAPSGDGLDSSLRFYENKVYRAISKGVDVGSICAATDRVLGYLAHAKFPQIPRELLPKNFKIEDYNAI